MDLDEVLDPDNPGSDDEELNENGKTSRNATELADGNLLDEEALADRLRDQWDLNPPIGANECLLSPFIDLILRSRARPSWTFTKPCRG
jgi:hypothetical protein